MDREQNWTMQLRCQYYYTCNVLLFLKHFYLTLTLTFHITIQFLPLTVQCCMSCDLVRFSVFTGLSLTHSIYLSSLQTTPCTRTLSASVGCWRTASTAPGFAFCSSPTLNTFTFTTHRHCTATNQHTRYGFSPICKTVVILNSLALSHNINIDKWFMCHAVWQVSLSPTYSPITAS